MNQPEACMSKMKSASNSFWYMLSWSVGNKMGHIAEHFARGVPFLKGLVLFSAEKVLTECSQAPTGLPFILAVE